MATARTGTTAETATSTAATAADKIAATTVTATAARTAATTKVGGVLPRRGGGCRRLLSLGRGLGHRDGRSRSVRVGRPDPAHHYAVRVGLHGRKRQLGARLFVGHLERNSELLELTGPDAPARPCHGVDPLGDLLALVVDRLVEPGHLHGPAPALDGLEARRDDLLRESERHTRGVGVVALIGHADREAREAARLPLPG